MFYLHINGKVKSKHIDYRQAWKQFNRHIKYGNHAQIYHLDHLCADSERDDRYNDKPEDYCDGP